MASLPHSIGWHKRRRLHAPDASKSSRPSLFEEAEAASDAETVAGSPTRGEVDKDCEHAVTGPSLCSSAERTGAVCAFDADTSVFSAHSLVAPSCSSERTSSSTVLGGSDVAPAEQQKHSLDGQHIQQSEEDTVISVGADVAGLSSTQKAVEAESQHAGLSQPHKQRTHKRLTPYMRPLKREIATLPPELWSGQGVPPRLRYVLVEDTTDRSHYFMCGYCDCDKVYRKMDGMVKHLSSGECPQGQQEFLRLHAETSVLAGARPMLLESGQSSCLAFAPPLPPTKGLSLNVEAAPAHRSGPWATPNGAALHTQEKSHAGIAARGTPAGAIEAHSAALVAAQPLAPIRSDSAVVERWRRAAGAILDAASVEASVAPVACKPVGGQPVAENSFFQSVVRRGSIGMSTCTPAEAKVKSLRELASLCPTWYKELTAGVQGLLGRTAPELARLVAVARQRPEKNPLVAGGFGMAPPRSRGRPPSPPAAPHASSTPSSQLLASKRQTQTVEELLARVAKTGSAPFDFASCRSPFLKRMQAASDGRGHTPGADLEVVHVG